MFIVGALIAFIRYTDFDEYCLVEFIINYLNDSLAIVYIMSFVLILVASEVYNGSKNTFDDYLYLRTGNRKNWLKCMVLYTVVLCARVLLIFIAISAFMYFLFSKQFVFYSNEWKMTDYWIIGIDHFSAIIFSILFVWARLFLISLIILQINLICTRFPFGFVSVLFFMVIDLTYQVFHINKPLNLLPIEHTRIFYTEAMAPAFGHVARGDIFSSIVYWLFLISLVLYTLEKTVNKKDFMIQEVTQ